MAPDEIQRQLHASLTEAMAAAQQCLARAEAEEATWLTALAAQGIPAGRWCPPGPSVPLCLHCGRIDRWYQRCDSGIVRCACAILPA